MPTDAIPLEPPPYSKEIRPEGSRLCRCVAVWSVMDKLTNTGSQALPWESSRNLAIAFFSFASVKRCPVEMTRHRPSVSRARSGTVSPQLVTCALGLRPRLAIGHGSLSSSG
jgi:hypothetical protein